MANVLEKCGDINVTNARKKEQISVRAVTEAVFVPMTLQEGELVVKFTST